MRYRDIAAQHSVSEKTDSNSYLLQLERDTRAGMLILHILDKNTGKRTEVRGKMGYETNGYDPNDKLHQLLDKVGKSASISDLMNGDVVSINPRHPDAKRAQSAADTAYDEDQHPNDTPRGPETKPAMPKGTVRVDVSDVYDWYKLGQHISNLKGLGKHDFGKGPPSSIISFGSEEEEHKFIQYLKQLGLDITDIDPGKTKGVKSDPTYNVESFDTDVEWVSDLNSRNVQVFATKIDDAYIELTYKRVFPADVYISFTRGGRMSVTGEGSQNKIFGAVINHVKQWVAKNKPPRIIFSAFKPNTGPFGSQDTTRSGLYSKMVQRFAGQNGYDYDIENTGSEDTFVLTRKQQPTQTTESLDQPYPYRWVVQSEDEWAARARTDSGAILDIRFEYGSWDAQWDIEFTLNGRYKATAAGDQFRIFATVVKAIKEWWKSTSAEGIPVNTIRFSADKLNNQTGKTGSREKLYNRFAQQFANSIGFTIQSRDKIDATDFELINPNYNEHKVSEAVEPNFNFEWEEARSFQPQTTPLQALVLEYLTFTSTGIMTIVSDGAKSPQAAEELKKVFQTLNQSNKKLQAVANDKQKLEANKTAILKNIYDMMTYAIAHLKANMIPQEFDSKKKQINSVLTKYNDLTKNESIIEAVEPNFDFEWKEAERYPEFVKIGKEAWIELASKGKAVTIKSAKGINNTDAADPDSFKSLDKDKQARVLAQLKSGNVEMPIVAVYPDGWKELIGGNTRLTAMLAQDGRATVWAFKVPDEVAELSENFNESKYGAPFTFKIKRRKLNVPALIKAGAIFITYPHGEQGWETDDNRVWSYSLISLYNVQGGGWTKDAKNYLKPQSYKRAEQQINSSAPNLGSDQLVYDGKYNQILWSIKKLGIPDNVAFLDNGQQDVAENFADGKNPGRKGLSKRMGVNTKASVSSLRKTAKNSSGEKQRMAHWLANMKAGRKKAAKK